jgi:predicted peroxiredoxin
MKTTLAAGVLVALVAAGVGLAALMGNASFAEAAEAAKPPILVNVTRGMEDLHAVSMGLGLARNALDDGHEVTVFLNVHAPVFADENASADLKVADFPPVKEMVAAVIGHGGAVYVCAHCARVCGVETADLMEGVQLSGHGEILEALAPGTVGFSY